jgi:hypothetical protein
MNRDCDDPSFLFAFPPRGRPHREKKKNGLQVRLRQLIFVAHLFATFVLIMCGDVASAITKFSFVSNFARMFGSRVAQASTRGFASYAEKTGTWRWL